MVPHNRLGEAQLAVLNRCLQVKQGRLWIQGVAGSGKTVLLVHAIREALIENSNLSVCVVVFTHALKDLVKTGMPEHLGHVPVMTYHSFLSNPRQYDLIVVDEVQDLKENELANLAQCATKLIVAGDGDQSIYVGGVSQAQIVKLLSPETHRLAVLYRLTEKLRQIARAILPQTHIETAAMGRTNPNVDVRLAHASDSESEIAWVWRQSARYARPTDPSAILLPNKRMINRFINSVCRMQDIPEPAYVTLENRGVDYNTINAHLAKHAINLRYIGNDFGALSESDERPIIYLMTYHSAKGLDYDTVFLPHLDSTTCFWRDDEQLARRLFFVAATRCRRNLIMSYHTQHPHPYVASLPQNLINLEDCTTPQTATNTDIDLF
jgi:superfamily I DNA/RNA helicase